MDKQLAHRLISFKDQTGKLIVGFKSQAGKTVVGFSGQDGKFVNVGDVLGSGSWAVTFANEPSAKIKQAFEGLGYKIQVGTEPPTGAIVLHLRSGSVLAWADDRAREGTRTPARTPARMDESQTSPVLDVFPRSSPKVKKMKKTKTVEIEPVTMTMRKDDLLETAAKLNQAFAAS